jgi:hypothetical protein
MEKTLDRVSWKAKWRIDKFKDPTNEIAKALQTGTSTDEAISLYSKAFICTEKFEANIALNEGLQELIDIICGLGTQTGLQAATNKTFKAMDTGYPQRSNQTAEWRATFGSADANYAWEEYTVVNAADDTGDNLNRKTASKGTKSSGETWTLSLQITFS